MAKGDAVGGRRTAATTTTTTSGRRPVAGSGTRVAATPGSGPAAGRAPGTETTGNGVGRDGDLGLDGDVDTGVHSATIRLPFLTARFEVPRHPGTDEPVRVGPVRIPSPGKAVYYMGLGVLAAVEIVEWPVAAAIAAGTYVAQHTSRSERAVEVHGHERRGHGNGGHGNGGRSGNGGRGDDR